MEIKNPHAVKMGKRLKDIISLRKESYQKFAEISGIAQNTLIQYINGVCMLPLEFIYDLHEKLNINPLFLLHGYEPIILDEDQSLKSYEKSLINKSKQPVDAMDLIGDNRIPYNSISRHGSNSRLDYQESKSIIRMAINGLPNPAAIRITDEKFINMYKSLCSDYMMNCIAVVSGVTEDGDVILLKSGRDHRIALWEDGRYYDKITGEEIMNVCKDDIVGMLYGIYILL